MEAQSLIVPTAAEPLCHDCFCVVAETSLRSMPLAQRLPLLQAVQRVSPKMAAAHL
jgi:hypothetical protein